jgi:glyoxylase I family protein
MRHASARVSDALPRRLEVSLASLHDTLLELESMHLKPEVRRSPADIERLLAPGFVEFGSSGRVHSRASVLEALRTEAPVERRIEDYSVRELGEGVALATYRVVRAGGAASLRCSLWRREGSQWRLEFHQGTPIR